MSGRKTIARGIAGAFGILAVLLLVPVSVSSGRIDLDRDGTFSIAGSYALRGGPALSGEFIKPRGGFDLRLEGGVS